MGLRGPGARPRQTPAAGKPKSKRRPPWKRKGLSRPQRVIAFLQSLPITKGMLAGKRMKLLPEQREFVHEVYGKLRPDGTRIRTLAIQSEPKGNGKTGMTAALALCHLAGPEAEPRGEVYSAAVSRDQAAIMFNEMEAIVLRTPDLAERLNIVRFHKKMEVLSGDGAGSIYEAMSADARGAQAIAPSLWVYDELAQAKNRELLDNLMNGMGKRAEPLGIVLSTQAPDDHHPLSQLIDDALISTDQSTYLQLHAAPEDADPFDEAVWKACNPAWGRFLNVSEFRQKAERAQRMPSFEPSFRNLRLNQRVDAKAENRVVSLPVWKACEGHVDPVTLAGRACYGGLDLSGKHDLTALVLVFPRDDGGFDIVPRFWTPTGQLEARRPAERDLFKLWIKEKFLIPIPGPTIRTKFIAKALSDIAKTYKLKAIGYDRWRIDDLKADLADMDPPLVLPLEPFGQGFKDMAPAIEYFAELALSGALQHGAHPVLTASVAAAITVRDPAGNQKIDKEKSSARSSVRVDGAVALAMALGTARRHVEEKPLNIADFLANVVVA